MKNLKNFGQALSRQEMKTVFGGTEPGGGDCIYNSPNQCSPSCIYKPDGTPVSMYGWVCMPVANGGVCTRVICAVE